MSNQELPLSPSVSPAITGAISGVPGATGIADYNIKHSKERIGEILTEYEQLLQSRTYCHLGYPYNLDYDYSALHRLVEFSINNLGDPFIESNYGVHSRSFEVAVLDWFAELWDLPKEEYWGYMTACGTEGNLHGIWMGRENVTPIGATDVPVALIASRETHYSAWKAARMYCLEAHQIPTSTNGEMVYTEFETTLMKLKAECKRIVVVANIGTTIKGAIDNIDTMLEIIQRVGFQSDEYFVHLDGALFGMMLPFVEEDAAAKTITFCKSGIGSISVSGHKFLGSPVPCGIVITRKKFIERLSQDITYISSRDATILGSRNGHAPLFMWYALVKKGMNGISTDIKGCIENAEYMRDLLINSNINHVLLNKHSCTVVFQKPSSEEFIKKWQLACDGQLCHVVVMPNVSKEKIQEFVEALLFA
jgi:histidine decarboxylase